MPVSTRTRSGASGIPFPTKNRAQELADSWPAADVSVAAFHLKACGATEHDARIILNGLAWRGVRRVRAYVDRMSPEDVAGRVAEYRTEARKSGCTAAGGSTQRGDLLVVRQSVRWPWRVTGGEAHYAS